MVSSTDLRQLAHRPGENDKLRVLPDRSHRPRSAPGRFRPAAACASSRMKRSPLAGSNTRFSRTATLWRSNGCQPRSVPVLHYRRTDRADHCEEPAPAPRGGFGPGTTESGPAALQGRLSWGGSSAPAATAAWPSMGVSGTWHIFSPSHCWPHQHRPAASMMQVPLPQQRGSSVMCNSMMSPLRHSARHANLKCGRASGQLTIDAGLLAHRWAVICIP